MICQKRKYRCQYISFDFLSLPALSWCWSEDIEIKGINTPSSSVSGRGSIGGKGPLQYIVTLQNRSQTHFQASRWASQWVHVLQWDPIWCRRWCLGWAPLKCILIKSPKICTLVGGGGNHKHNSGSPLLIKSQIYQSTNTTFSFSMVEVD